MRRPRLKFALAAGAAVLLATAFGWSHRLPLATWAATRSLESQGFGPARFIVDAVDLHGFRAHDVSLRDGAIRAGAVTAEFRPLDLLRARLGQVDIAGLEVALALGKDGITLAGQPLDLAASGGFGVDAITLRDARISLDSTGGPIEAAISGSFVLAGQAMRATAIAAEITVPAGGTRRSARVTAPEFSLQPESAGGFQLRFAQTDITPDDLPWSAQAIAGELVWQSDRASAQLTVGQLQNGQRPMLAAPLGLSADATLTGPRIDFTIALKSGAKAAATIKGHHDRSANSGVASIAVEPVVFARGALQPADIFPALAGMVEDVQGSVALAGSLRWSVDGSSPDIVVRIKDLAFATSAFQLRGLNGAITFLSLWPPATPRRQMLTATIEAAGLPPSSLGIDGQLTVKPALKLERATLGIAGGTIIASPFTIDPAAPQLETALQVEQVDLGEIMKMLSVDGLDGTGRLDGVIPLRFADGKITISGGKLAAQGPGLLRYKPDKVPDEIASAGRSVELALQALADFHYDRLTLELDKSAGGEGTVLLRLEGHNPAVLSGQRFNFNIRLDSNFDRLADVALLSLRSAQEMLRQAARRTAQ